MIKQALKTVLVEPLNIFGNLVLISFCFRVLMIYKFIVTILLIYNIELRTIIFKVILVQDCQS